MSKVLVLCVFFSNKISGRNFLSRETGYFDDGIK